MRSQWILMAGLMSLSSSVWAQGCPSGIPSAGNPGCLPPSQQHSPYYQGNQAYEYQFPATRWATRWGAIAIDDLNGIAGAVIDKTSKRQAHKAAIAECNARGGKECEVRIAYHNQCAAIVWGKHKYSTASAETEELAVQIGMRSCSAADIDCQIYYSDCSLPVQIR